MPTFGDRLKKLREEKKLTQEQLANIFFLNKSSISRYEKNKQMPESEMLQKIADFFGVTIDYLLGRTDIRNSENFDLTSKDSNDIEEVIKELRKKLLNTEDLKFDGKLATKEDIETILDSVKVGMEMVKIKKRRNKQENSQLD